MVCVFVCVYYCYTSNHLACSGNTTTALLAGLVIGWILFIITLVGCATINGILVCSRRQVSESKM